MSLDRTVSATKQAAQIAKLAKQELEFAASHPSSFLVCALVIHLTSQRAHMTRSLHDCTSCTVRSMWARSCAPRSAFYQCST